MCRAKLGVSVRDADEFLCLSLFRFDRFNHFGLILQELKRERNTKDAETKRRENCHLTWLS